MRKIISIFRRDTKSSFRDFLIIYMIVAPILLTIGLKFFIPSANEAALNFALLDSLDKEVIEEFQKYGRVEKFKDIDVLKNRIKDNDDVAGIVEEKGRLKVILEGNENHDTEVIPQMIIKDITNDIESQITYSFSNIGQNISLVALYGTVGMIITAIVVGGMVIGLNVVEEKESDTMRAINVTPINKIQYVIGKSLIGIIIGIIDTYIILFILGFFGVNKMMALVLIIISSLVAVIFGFLVGVLSGNQMAAIANMKGLFILIGASVIGGIVLSSSNQIFLYWSPIYWSFVGFRDLILEELTWKTLIKYSAWISGITLLFFVALKRKISRGLY